jgi:hypothetical protein
MSALDEVQKKADLSVRKDPNATKRVGMSVRRVLTVNIPPQLNFKPAFPENNAYSAPNIYEFCQKIMYNWFPSNNFTRTPVSGSLTLNSLPVGNVDFTVIPGLTLDGINGINVDSVFTETRDTASSFIFVKGNLTLGDIILTPPTRKLFTVVYVAGNLTMGPLSQISMTQRGANHSGTGDSGGLTEEVQISVGTNTRILASGGAGANTNSTNVSANQGATGASTQSGLQTGGGGGGFWDYLPPLPPEEGEEGGGFPPE